MSDVAVRCVKRIILPVVLLLSVMVVLGVLVTRVFHRMWPFTVEDQLNHEFAAERTEDWNNISLIFSTLANTEVIILTTGVFAAVLWFRLRRWREPLFLIAAVSAQALVFLLTTIAIDRRRPVVEHMDVSPPTSSFPSGHTSAAVALYCGIALLVALRARRTSVKIAWWALLILVPIGVALTRMYRGMHHPSDVVASFVNGGSCVAIMARALLDRTVRRGRDRLPSMAALAAPATRAGGAPYGVD